MLSSEALLRLTALFLPSATCMITAQSCDRMYAIRDCGPSEEPLWVPWPLLARDIVLMPIANAVPGIPRAGARGLPCKGFGSRFPPTVSLLAAAHFNKCAAPALKKWPNCRRSPGALRPLSDRDGVSAV